jgi:hypothetical protein
MAILSWREEEERNNRKMDGSPCPACPENGYHGMLFKKMVSGDFHPFSPGLGDGAAGWAERD